MTLNLYEWGDPGAPPLVCLHGVTSYGGRFEHLATRLADRYHVIAPDLRGHGGSEWEPPWSLEAHLDDVLEVAPDGPAVWVGHSFGGRIAAELAVLHPGRVERLVLLDPALQVLPHVAYDMSENERADAAFPSVEAAVQARYDAGRVLLAPRELVIQSDAGHLEEGRDGLLRYRYCKSAVIAAWSIMATTPPPPAPVDTLMVVGADSWLTLDEQADAYREALGDRFTLVTVPGGHTVYWEALDETSDAIDSFLA